MERFLVVVAQGGDAPDESTLRAFVAGPSQGMVYHPGVWHHSLVVLDREAEFACFVWEDGSSGDCTVLELPPARRVSVALP